MATAKDPEQAKQIGARIRQARKEAGGMTQRELADLLGVTERSIAAYESGDVIPYRFLPRLESALGRPTAWFLYGESGLKAPNEQLDRIESMLKEVLDRLQPPRESGRQTFGA